MSQKSSVPQAVSFVSRSGTVASNVPEDTKMDGTAGKRQRSKWGEKMSNH